jgi:pimeloyl-ACP methyl ester carboxylesterase
MRRHPETAPYRLEDMADDAVAVLDGLGWRSAHIVGHSMGGMIAQTLAIRHPDRVRSLTWISSTPSAEIGRARPITILRLLRANPTVLIRATCARTGRRRRGPGAWAPRDRVTRLSPR